MLTSCGGILFALLLLLMAIAAVLIPLIAGQYLIALGLLVFFIFLGLFLSSLAA